MKEYYEQVFALINLLKREQHTEESKILQSCVEAGATGGEILMCIRFNLEKYYEAGSYRAATSKEMHRVSKLTTLLLGD